MSTAQHHRHKRRKQFHRKSSGAMCTPRRGLLYAQARAAMQTAPKLTPAFAALTKSARDETARETI